MFDEVGALVREVAASVIVPRFRALLAHEIEEKSPGELVTVADREAEELLSKALRTLLPSARVVGEERSAQKPELLQQLDQGDVWLVDPLDGTGNFIEGTPCFAVLVALLRQGEAVASWMFDPISDCLYRAQKGEGAYADGVPLRASLDAAPLAELRGSVLTKYMPAELKACVAPGCLGLKQVLPGLRCAGAEYPAIARGDHDFAVFFRTLPWDHVPGALFLSEAGGIALRYDGTPYLAGDERVGLLVAQNHTIWQEVQRALLLGEAPAAALR